MFLFADNLLLLSGSLIQLETLLVICYEYGIEIDISINAAKCHLVHVGKDHKIIFLY